MNGNYGQLRQRSKKKSRARIESLSPNLLKIKQFLLKNAEVIEDEATRQHKNYLTSKKLRHAFIEKFKGQHIKVVREVARQLGAQNTHIAAEEVRELGKQLAESALKNGLTIEESVNGSVFLKQAIWKKLEEAGLIKELSAVEIYQISQKLGTYIDVIGAQTAFTFHEYFRKAEEEQYKLAAIVNSSDDAIVSKTLAGTITSWNKSAERLFGYSAEEAIGQSITIIIPKELLHEEKTIISKIKRGERIEHFETVRLRKDGSRIQLSLTISPLKDNKGNIIGASKIARDITQRKQMEDNIRFLAEASKILSSSLDYKTTLSNIAKAAVPNIADWCAIDLLDGQGGLEQVAVAHKDPKKVKWAKELRKVDPPDMNAKTGVPNVIRTGQAELYPVFTDEMLAKAAKNREQLKLIRSLGFTSAMVVPLCHEGKCIGGITFVTTETKRHYHESDLTIAQELANRASLALENAGLYEQALLANKASQDAVALRDNFISVASHELKTPVTSVKIFTEVLKQHSEEIGDQKAKDHLIKMNRQLDKLTELIYNMLNISKIQAGRLEFNQKLFDLDKTVSEIVDVLQQGSSNHKIIIKGKTGKKVYGDEDRIGQVVSNLITNAIKYSPKAEKVNVHLSSDDKQVIVCVEDFGIGLAKEHGERIFERFYRVFDETDKTFPGLGIGLYISSEIINRHHGRLWVDSEIGKGSRFYFSLPLKRDKKPNGINLL